MVASGSVKVGKKSAANGGSTGSMRPRANTISHVDTSVLGMMAAANSSAARHHALDLNMGHVQQPAMNGLPGVTGYHFRGMSTAAGHHGNAHVLPKLETNNFNLDIGASLRTAPPYASHGDGISIDDMWYGQGNTINPAHLHFPQSPQSLAFDPISSPYNSTFAGMPQARPTMDEDGNFAWLNGFENQISFDNPNDQAIEASSPSAMSTGSRSGLSELMLDGSNNALQTTSIWQNSMISQAPGYPIDLTTPSFPDFFQPGQLSPKSMQAQISQNEQLFASPPPFSSNTPIPMMNHGLPDPLFHPPMVSQSETPSNSAASVSSSRNRQSSVTSVSTDSITDATRQALLTSLSQSSVFGHSNLKTSQPPVSSPLSPGFTSKSQSMNNVSLPSTYDLQRYVAAYIKYFHPHLPFLHIPSLSFDSPEFTNNLRISSPLTAFAHSRIAGGGGALILSMAAIGAFYEYDTGPSKDLFEMAKRMIQLYLEERRKADVNATVNGPQAGYESSAQNTPLWLVQAMLLNVIYGHNCGDKTSAGIASTHCAALVSLARAAELAKPVPDTSSHEPIPQSQPSDSPDASMSNDDANCERRAMQQQYSSLNIYTEWHNWKMIEERKRTLYAIFILSSLLVSAYNHAPALMNSEIRHDLPCEEELWAAETAEAWNGLGGSQIADQNAVPFASALTSLLTASQRHPHQPSDQFDQPFGSSFKTEDLPESDFRPSTFGCLVLINALHNYIWETRQRHMGRSWTTEETDSMHAHMEPALKAWQAAWASNPQHSLERPNPFGAGSLSADCIPLLDLAYIRLFVNMGRSKEAFFQRDWEGMAAELARGSEIVQHADHSPATGNDSIALSSHTGHASPLSGGTHTKAEEVEPTATATPDPNQSAQASKRERHLRKAAYFAANSLTMSDKLGVTFADFNSRELPLQSALCAFDCAQILAEWVAAVQQRVGPYLGILGKDAIDFSQVPAIVLLSDEDTKLLEKIDDILSSAEVKLADSGSTCATAALSSVSDLANMKDCGYCSKILRVTAQMLEKAAVWPITQEMAQSLETQAAHMKERAASSIVPNAQA